MTTPNCNELPNHLALHSNPMLGLRFGEIRSITPVNLPGDGHRPYIRVRYEGGLVVDYSPATAAALARQFPAALAYMPDAPNVSGALADLEEV